MNKPRVRNEHRRAYKRGELDGLTPEQIKSIQADLDKIFNKKAKESKKKSFFGSISEYERLEEDE